MRTFTRASVSRILARLTRGGDRGFTVVETLAAVAVMVLGLIGLLASMTSGVTDLDTARRQTTALFLAEQRLEQVKACALSKSSTLGYTNVTTTTFPAEGYNAIPGYGDYRRSVTIVNNPGGLANTKQVEVWVFYKAVTGKGQGTETSAVVSTLVVSR